MLGWEHVLAVTHSLTLPTSKLLDLFEQIVLELAELREVDTARALMRAAPALQSMRRESPERYLFLEHLLQRAANSQPWDPAVAYPSGSKETRRAALAVSLGAEVHVVPPSRLLSLLSQSLKYQQLQGLLPRGAKGYDVFRGVSALDSSAPGAVGAGGDEAFPTRNTRVIKFGAESYPEIVRFSPDGLILASGSCDGYIELWDPDSGKLNTADFSYQAEDALMSHDSAVLTLAFNLGMELLASGAAKGDVKIWRLSTGSCVRKFPTAHSGGLTSLEFTRDGTQILTASFDGSAKIHGLKSGRTLKEFRGHSSFVTGAVFVGANAAAEQVMTCSADGTVRLWDAKSCDCLRSIRLSPAGAATSLLGLVKLPFSSTILPALASAAAAGASSAAAAAAQASQAITQERFVVMERSGTLRIINAEGAVLASFQSTSSGGAAGGSAATAAAAAHAAGAGGKAAAASAALRKKTAGEGPASLGDFVAVCVSPKGCFVYGVTEECVLHCFEVATNKLVHAIKLHKSDVLGIAHHPHRNLLASHAQEGTIKLWRP